MNSLEDIDFQISFFEKIIKERPNFVNALVALGEVYTRKGRYREGLEVDKRLTVLRPNDSTVYYNLACSYSLLKMSDECLQALKEAIRLGYNEFDYMERDPDLGFIRLDPRYKKLLYEARKKGD